MRDILFRGKRLCDGKWEYGNLFIDEKKDKYKILIGYANYRIGWEVDPATVGQYTGLTANGKKVFEGDILKIAKVSDGTGHYYFPPLEYPVNAVVKWDLCAWMWETLCDDKRYIGFPEAWCHYECEVIGNIHDNPGLLEG